jgi:DNA polymerase III epsilon subunit-like protein
MYVWDLEADGLLDTITKIHCLSYTSDGVNFTTLSDYKQMRDFLNSATVLVAHNQVRYDIRAVKKILGLDVKAKLYDTLAMSWVFEPNRPKHGLDSWGETVGIPKPKIDDWENLTPQEYQHRCEEDVKINWLVWQRLIKKAKLIYDDKKELDRFLQYLTFKMESAAKAEDAMWKVDVDLVQRCIDELTLAQEQKVEELRNHMPMVQKYRKKEFPKQPFKKDGSLSAQGLQWKQLLKDNGLPSNYKGDIDIPTKVEQANPNSPDQVKDWLFSLGWEPCTFDFKKNDDGSERTVPQVRKDGELTPSVQLLIDNNPGVAVLDGLTVIQHRLSIFKGFMECQVDGYLKAEIDGLTNTLRFKHKKPLVNLPGVDKPWGKEVRGALIAPEGYVLCGADMVSLESTTKRHYLHPYDPDYVAEMSTPGFDEHLDLAVRADYLSEDDYNFYIRSDEDTVNDVVRFKAIKKVRKLFKPVNYSAIYGVGQKKLSRTAGMSLKEAGILLEAYWKRNWGIQEFAKDVLKTVKTVDGMMWIKNPVSGFWYSLRYEKDAFSTINQGTGVYCFDTWLAYYLSRRPNIVGQFHDESINCIKDGEQAEHTEVLKWAIGKVNEKLKLNIDLDIDVKFGLTYSEVH